MVNPLTQIDYSLLKIINVDLGDSTMDQFWLTVTHLERHWFARIAVLVLLAWGFSIYRWSFLKVVGLLGLAVGLTDLFCYRLIKGLIDRPRPFLNLEIVSWLRHVGDAHGPSFPSNHAANTMAGAVVLSAFFKNQRHYFYIFAALVALSRPALGVHYPSDVIAGAAFGYILSRLLTDFLFSRYPQYMSLTKPEKTQREDSEEVG